jgi:hypothetical protein
LNAVERLISISRRFARVKKIGGLVIVGKHILCQPQKALNVRFLTPSLSNRAGNDVKNPNTLSGTAVAFERSTMKAVPPSVTGQPALAALSSVG